MKPSWFPSSPGPDNSGLGSVSASDAILCQFDGSATTGVCSATLDQGSGSLDLTAVPSEGSAFVGWLGDCSGSTTCTLSLSHSHAVQAAFMIKNLVTVTNDPRLHRYCGRDKFPGRNRLFFANHFQRRWFLRGRIPRRQLGHADCHAGSILRVRPLVGGLHWEHLHPDGQWAGYNFRAQSRELPPLNRDSGGQRGFGGHHQLASRHRLHRGSSCHFRRVYRDVHWRYGRDVARNPGIWLRVHVLGGTGRRPRGLYH